MGECGVWDAGMSTCLWGSWTTLCRQGMRPQTTRELPAGRPSHSCPSEAPGQHSEIVQAEPLCFLGVSRLQVTRYI